MKKLAVALAFLTQPLFAETTAQDLLEKGLNALVKVEDNINNLNQDKLDRIANQVDKIVAIVDEQEGVETEKCSEDTREGGMYNRSAKDKLEGLSTKFDYRLRDQLDGWVAEHMNKSCDNIDKFIAQVKNLYNVLNSTQTREDREMTYEMASRICELDRNMKDEVHSLIWDLMVREISHAERGRQALIFVEEEFMTCD